MSSYKFNFGEKEYELSDNNFDYMLNDEEQPVSGFEREDVLMLLSQYDKVNFDVEYYDRPCEACLAGKAEKVKVFKFLEYHFYIFTKKGNYIISSISKEYENTTFTHLLNSGKIDNSYIVSVMVCESCGHYSIEIEQCEM
jgi:hypothetical protein